MDSLVSVSNMRDRDFKSLSKQLQWRRPQDIFTDSPLYVFNGQATAYDVRQGLLLKNDRLMAVLCALASKRGVIEEMFEKTKVINDKGIYAIWFYLGGERKLITIDSFLPVDPERVETYKQRPVFAQNK